MSSLYVSFSEKLANKKTILNIWVESSATTAADIVIALNSKQTCLVLSSCLKELKQNFENLL